MTLAEGIFVFVIFIVALALWTAADKPQFDNKTYWENKERKWRR